MRKTRQSTGLFGKTSVLITCIIASCLIMGSTLKANAGTNNFQTTASVPELDALHESIYILWHDAYPNKNYDMIKSSMPGLTASVSKLSKATLPEILHSKKTKWDSEIKNLESNLSALQKAADEDNKESMLNNVESLHGSYEKLVRIIRPVLSELDSFHEDLYKVYHSYMPVNDTEKIKAIIPSMKMKIGQLKQARLPQRLADRQNKFTEAVSKLEISLNEAENSIKTGSKEKIKSAIEKLHSDYQSIDLLLQ